MAKYVMKRVALIKPADVVLSPQGRMVFLKRESSPSGLNVWLEGRCPDTGERMKFQVGQDEQVPCER